MKIIRPSVDLGSKYKKISKQTKEEQKPVYITVNGRVDTVLINQALYEQQIGELEVLRYLAEAEYDVIQGNVTDADKTLADIRKAWFK